MTNAGRNYEDPKRNLSSSDNRGIDRKNDLLQEFGLACSGSRGSQTSISSSVLRAHMRGEAAAALKKAEMQRKINELPSKSVTALELEERERGEDELAFARRKWEEQARLESLRVEQEAAAAVARAKAIDEELGLSHEYQLPDLPVEEPGSVLRNISTANRGNLSLEATHHASLPLVSRLSQSRRKSKIL